MATHSSILAWEITWIEEPGGLQSIVSQRVGYDWATKHVPQIFLTLLSEETVFSPFLCSCLICCRLVDHECVFISGLSILFYWTAYLFLCQYHTVSIIVALEYSQIREQDSSSSVLLKIALAIWGLLSFPTNFRIILVLWKMPLVLWEGLHWTCRFPWLVWPF